MLERLLAELENGQTQSVAGLAKRLDTTPALIEMMLEDLERRGQVEVVGLCQETCADCPLGSICAMENRQRLWQAKPIRKSITNQTQ